MSIDYAAIREDVIRPVLVEYGTEMSMFTVGEGSYDVSSGKVTANSKSEIKAIGFEAEYDPKEIDGTLIKSGDRRVFMLTESPLSDAIIIRAADYSVNVNSSNWPVVKIKPIGPSNQSLIYDVQMRM